MQRRSAISYDDIEIRYDNLMVFYNEENGEYIFVEKKYRADIYEKYSPEVYKHYGTYLVDAITKGKIQADYELDGFKPFDKALILEKGKNYTPNELLKIYNAMLESKVNFTFPKQSTKPERKVTKQKEAIEINDTTSFDYDDIEIRFNKDHQDFYFLKIELDEMMNMMLFDAISGMRISLDKITSYVHFDKALVLEKGRPYTSNELHEIYKVMNAGKVNFTFPESNNSPKNKNIFKVTIPEEIPVTDDTKFKYDELEARINYGTGSLYFLVKKIFSNDSYLTKTVRYDAISGQKVSDLLLAEYEELEKTIIFPAKRDYTSKEISAKYRLLHENGIIIPDEINPNEEKKGSK